MYLFQNIAVVGAVRKILVYVTFFARTFNKITDFKIKPVVIISFIGDVFH